MGVGECQNRFSFLVDLGTYIDILGEIISYDMFQRT